MADTASPDVTGLLRTWTGGDSSAQEKLAPILWRELRQNAHAYMRHERAGHTLQATALVNEAFIRLVDLRRIEWRDRSHFFTMASQMMRRVSEMRFFGGLSVEETAQALNVSSQTVLRDWSLAKAWLRREMSKPALARPAHG